MKHFSKNTVLLALHRLHVNFVMLPEGRCFHRKKGNSILYVRFKSLDLFAALFFATGMFVCSAGAEASDTSLEDRVERIESAGLYRNWGLGITAVLGVASLFLGALNFTTARKNRLKDQEIKTFETNYEGGIQSALAQIENNTSNFLIAVDEPDPSKRVEKAKRIWKDEFTPSLTSLSEQLQKLDESENIIENGWSSLPDHHVDNLAKSVDTLLVEDESPTSVNCAILNFGRIARRLAEDIRSKIIQYKKKIT